MKSLFLLLVIIVTRGLTLSTSPQTLIIQPPFRNTTTNTTLRFLDHTWPRVPFGDLIVDGIVLRFINVSPIDDDQDEEYNLLVRTAILELAAWFSHIETNIPFWRLHKEAGPTVFDLRTTGWRPVTGKQIGLCLDHVRSLFYHYGPASVTARLFYEGTVQVGSFSIFVPFPEVAGS